MVVVEQTINTKNMFEDRPWLMVLIYGLLVSVLFPIILGVISWKRLFMGLQIFLISQSVYFVILSICLWLSFNSRDASYWSYLSAFNDCIAYCLVFYLLLNNENTKKIIIYSIALLCTYLFIEFIVKLNAKSNITLFSLTIETIFINTLTLLFIVRMMIALPFKSLLENPIFWFGIAKLIPATYSLGLEMFQDYLISDNLSFYYKMYGFDLGLHILGNLLYSYSIWLSLRFDFSVFTKI